MGILDYFNVAGGYDPSSATNVKPGMFNMNMPNLFMTEPGYANAFLTDEQKQQLQNQATKKGLLTGALTYLATPKNLGLGTPVPYLAKAYLGGMQGAQGTYDTATKNLSDMLTLQKLGKQIELQGMTAGEKAQRYYNEVAARLSQDPNNAALKQELVNATNQLKKETTFAPPNIVFQQEGAEKKVVGDYFGKTYTNLLEADIKSNARVAKLERVSDLLQGVQTGKFSNFGLELSKGFKEAGFPVGDKVGNIEAANSLMQQLALEFKNASGENAMPGSMSDADREYLNTASGKLTNTPEGRALMLETSRALAKRDKDIARLAREYRKKNGTIDEGFYDVLSDFSEKNPMFPQAKKGISLSQQPMVGGTEQTTGQSGWRVKQGANQ